MSKDTSKVHGHYVIELVGPDGVVKERREVDNLVVTTGRNFIADRMLGTTFAAMSHMAAGSNATAPALGDTTLGTELGRVALGTATRSTNVNTYTATFGAGIATGTIAEVGILNNSSGGTLLGRATFSGIVKGGADILNVTYTVTVS